MSITTAIEKINKEIQETPDDTFAEIIGQYIIDRCEDPVVAIAVAHETKTLRSCIGQIMETARKAAKNNTAVMTPAQVFAVVDAYFGMTTDLAAQQKAIMAASSPAGIGVQATPTPKPAGKAINLDFDSLI